MLLRKTVTLNLATTFMSFARHFESALAVLMVSRVGNTEIRLIGFHDARELNFLHHDAEGIEDFVSPTKRGFEIDVACVSAFPKRKPVKKTVDVFLPD